MFYICILSTINKSSSVNYYAFDKVRTDLLAFLKKEITFYIIQFYSRIHGWENPSEMAGFPGAWNIRKHKLRYI